MNNQELTALFDQQAPAYDQQWERLAPMREALHLLVGAVFARLPPDARVLCVGAGTGLEMAHFARQFPGWTFTAVEPSAAMLKICRERAAAEGFADRCRFHEGYLDSLADAQPHDAATCFLVSQFLLDRAERAVFFRTIAQRLRPGGVLASSDLASDGSANSEALLRMWFTLMAKAELSDEAMARMRSAYAKDVAILPPAAIADIIASAGFGAPVPFFQAGLIHGWFSERAA